jgi:hypothetical protein
MTCYKCGKAGGTEHTVHRFDSLQVPHISSLSAPHTHRILASSWGDGTYGSPIRFVTSSTLFHTFSTMPHPSIQLGGWNIRSRDQIRYQCNTLPQHTFSTSYAPHASIQLWGWNIRSRDQIRYQCNTLPQHTFSTSYAPHASIQLWGWNIRSRDQIRHKSHTFPHCQHLVRTAS